jgi:NAD(P)-dependent dehydrogenase (short-subunit alcohol dehydrogenase family)
MRTNDSGILKGQKSLVTGASSGIDKAIAIALGKAGADVVVNCGRNRAEADKVVAEVEGSGSHAFVFQADVSQEGSGPGDVRSNERAVRRGRSSSITLVPRKIRLSIR